MRKIYFNTICAICAMGALVSCSDFLEVESRDEILLDNFWNEKSDVEGILAGCYSGLQSTENVKRMIVWGEVRSENCVRGTLQNEDGSLENVLKENINAMNAYTSWEGFYNVINRCNTLIKFAPDVAAQDPSYTQSELKGHIAEVSALRDLCYFYLIRTFHDVPYTTEAYIDDSQQMDLPATPFEEVLDSLIADLRSISDSRTAVEYYPTTKKGYQTARITLDAVNAMLCEMYLWKKDYANCVKYADLVIASKKKQYEENMQNSKSSQQSNVVSTRFHGYPLQDGAYTSGGSLYDAGYNALFVTGGNNETIFELAYDNTPMSSGMISNDAVALFYGRIDNNGYLAPSSYVSDDVSSELYQVYNEKNKKLDTRAYINTTGGSSATIRKFAESGTYLNASSSSSPEAVKGTKASVVYESGKFKRSYNSQNWIIYRLSDIMLLKAEALAQTMRTGNDKEDADYNAPIRDEIFELVDAVNKRALAQPTAGMTNVLSKDDYTTKIQVEDLVLAERHRELMFEGKRWYDLVRRSLRDGNSQVLTSAVLKKVTTNSGFIQNFLSNQQTFPYQLFWPYSYDEEYNVNKNLQKTHNPAFGSGKNSNIE